VLKSDNIPKRKRRFTKNAKRKLDRNIPQRVAREFKRMFLEYKDV